MHIIPPITDPLGRHWTQPELEHVLVDATHAVVDARDFDLLPEYSRTRPTGVYPGKMWKSITRDGTAYLCWFGIVDGRPDVCSNNSRLLLVAGQKERLQQAEGGVP